MFGRTRAFDLRGRAPTTRSVRLSIRTKLLGSTLLLVLLTAVIAVLAITRLGGVKDHGDELYNKAYSPTVASVYAGTLAKDLALQSQSYLTLLAEHDGDGNAVDADKRLVTINANNAKDQKGLKALLPMLDRAPVELQPLAKRIRNGITTYSATLKTLQGMSSDDPRNGPLNAKLRQQITTIVDGASAFSAKSDAYAKHANREIADAYTSGRTLIVVALLLAVALGLAAALRISGEIRRGVLGIRRQLTSLREHDTASLRDGLDAIADGDLTCRAAVTTQPAGRCSNDEIGDIAETVDEITLDTARSIERYNSSLDALSGMIGRVGHSATVLSDASGQMAATSDEAGRAVGEIAHAITDVAQGAERQVIAISGARRLTDEMAEATRRSAESAVETARAAEAAREVATNGAASVAQATEAIAAVRAASTEATGAIRELGAKSEQIGGIVDAITGIAEQTNLLALNAAIEAARAGEQGRGFAVVADEVRKLAEESQTAAASISALIAEIQSETKHAVEVVELGGRRTDDGTKTVDDAREAFEVIRRHVQDMSERVSEIATAVQALSATSARVGEEVGAVATVAGETSAATEQVSASTEQTSASTQEIAASAATLASTAGELRELVGRFTLA